jgi:hypothetical protein
LPPEQDPISLAVAQLVGGHSYAQLPDQKWVMVTAPRKLDIMTAALEVSRRPWAPRKDPPFCGESGYLYSLSVIAVNDRCFDFKQVLERAQQYEDDILHILLEFSYSAVRFTFPAVLGQQRLEQIIGDLFGIAFQSIRHRIRGDYDHTSEVQQLANSQPEHVLGPSNPLVYLSPDMPATFFLL